MNPPLLALRYTTVDGAVDEAEAHALCYACHNREKVLDSPQFPLHRHHVEKQKASCATCHSAHGSIQNRALIRFGEETTIAGVSPSLGAGKLLFESDAPGTGRCYLMCHGVDHAPKSYGLASGQHRMPQNRGRSNAPAFNLVGPRTGTPVAPRVPDPGGDPR